VGFNTPSSVLPPIESKGASTPTVLLHPTVTLVSDECYCPSCFFNEKRALPLLIQADCPS
jgi:hypothetical protein